MPNSLEDLIQQLQQQAGSRGSTFAGRLMPKGSNQSIGDVMSKPPIGELETAGNIDLDAIKSLGSLMAAGIPAIVKKMRLPESFSANTTIDKMYKEALEGMREQGAERLVTKDEFINNMLYDLANSAKEGQYNLVTKNRPNFPNLSNTTDRWTYKKDPNTKEFLAHPIPRKEQLASTLTIADRMGALDNKKILEQIRTNKYKRIGMDVSSDVSQDKLDWYKQFLEQIMPDK